MAHRGPPGASGSKPLWNRSDPFAAAKLTLCKEKKQK
jgi:hypothetical protein